MRSYRWRLAPDGEHIVSGSRDSTLRLWDASSEGWLKIACNRLRYHPLLNEPETMIKDAAFLQVAIRAKAVCKRY